MLGKHALERQAMMQQEDELSADELLDEERRRADLARGVFNYRFCGVGTGVFSGEARGSGQLSEINRRQYPPPIFQLVKNNARLFCFDRIDRLAIGETPVAGLVPAHTKRSGGAVPCALLCKSHHALC